MPLKKHPFLGRIRVCRAPSLSLPLSVHASRWPTRSTAMPTNPKTDDAGLPTSLRDTEAMLFVCAGMMPGFLRDQHYKNDNTRCDDGRGLEAAQREPAVVHRLVEQIAHCGTKGSGEDERSPEQPTQPLPARRRRQARRLRIRGRSYRPRNHSAVPNVWENMIVAQ